MIVYIIIAIISSFVTVLILKLINHKTDGEFMISGNTCAINLNITEEEINSRKSISLKVVHNYILNE